MKQTAVEWLIDESMKLVVQYMQGTLNEDTLDGVIYKIGTKAKEMEKEHLCYFYVKGAEAEINNPYVSNIEFYNETFKSE